jgi:putative Ca2+/H+ antiporter (TMEM165/GDT1 family)
MSDWLVAFGATFVTIFLAEMGDKTQLMTISFAAKYPRWLVFWAVFLAMALLTAMAVLIGEVIVQVVPLDYIKVASGIVFIAFGAWGIHKRNEEEEEEDAKEDGKGRGPFAMIFGMLVLAELGDKTQLMAIALSAKYHAPVPVMIGGILGFAAVVAVGVLAGELISRKVKRAHIAIGAGVFSIVLGAYFIAEGTGLL